MSAKQQEESLLGITELRYDDKDMLYHAQSPVQVLKALKSSREGLNEGLVKRHQEQFGLNQLVATTKVSPLKILLRQFASFLVFLLLGAAILSYMVGEEIDAVVILAVLVVNAAVGFFQEYKAEAALARLKDLETPMATVIRNGEEQEVAAAELVPGDIVVLTEGQRVAADGRLVEVQGLEIDQSMLTGESTAVLKQVHVQPETVALADRTNMVYSSTMVAKGRGKFVVTAIGMETEFGKIARLVQKVEAAATPLQITLKRLSYILGLISLGLIVVIGVEGLVLGRDWYEVMLTAVALAISAIPEGLPIVVTVALAFGVRRMVKRQVLVRRLSAVEALGSVDIICSDKTGTITQNKMEVSHLYTFDLGEVAFKGNISQVKKGAPELIRAALLCNDATLKTGDPTERALVSFAYDTGETVSLRHSFPRLDEVPFTSDRKYMVTLNQLGSKKVAFAKGAPEKIIGLCQLSKDQKRKILEEIEAMSGQGMRVLGFASRPGQAGIKRASDYNFLGLIGLIDPPRKSVAAALAKCRAAGIRVIMITGDHPITAQAVANQVGIESENVITGREMDAMSEAKLRTVVNATNIFARVTPENKLQILAALQKQGRFVAMTGDGVNDAPALKEANIGVAVGSGSDLTKEVADMVILDNDFASIVKAVREGRGIFSNIKKAVTFIIAVNFDEVIILAVSIFAGLPLPLLPIHLLWLNLVTDTLPSLSLSVDPYDKTIMSVPPYDPRQEITKGVFGFSVAAGLLAFAASFSVFLIELYLFKSSVLRAQTVTFTVTVFFELLFIFVVRTRGRLKDSKPFANRWLLGAIAAGVVLQFLAIYGPFAQQIFKTEALGWPDLAMMIPFVFSGVIIFEVVRSVRQKFWLDQPPGGELKSN